LAFPREGKGKQKTVKKEREGNKNKEEKKAKRVKKIEGSEEKERTKRGPPQSKKYSERRQKVKKKKGKSGSFSFSFRTWFGLCVFLFFSSRGSGESLFGLRSSRRRQNGLLSADAGRESLREIPVGCPYEISRGT
jgi:hypothetical protein